MMKKTSPSWTSNDTSKRTLFDPKDFLRFLNEITRESFGG
jgi:hypothetical protein